jgi:hypothetical protein
VSSFAGGDLRWCRTVCRSQKWIAGNPIDVLATNFGKPAALFEKFPRKDVFIAP